MRLRELRLTAVGPFTDTTLDLSGGRQGLHVLYGPNEAGKSSALRAIRYLLYGFPTQVADDFRHSYPQLRVGARLVNDAGEELNITRRKARQKSLRDGPDDQEIGEELLQRWLGHASEEMFVHSFGIGHAELVQGGQEIVAGGGDLGQLIFSGAGIAHLRELDQQLEQQARELFTDRGTKQKINILLSDLKSARQLVQKKQLRPAEWEDHYYRLQTALQRKQLVETERREARAERDRLERYRLALDLIAEYFELQRSAAEAGHVVRLSADFNRRRESVLRELSSATAKRRTALEEIDRRERELAGIQVPAGVLEHRAALAQLEENLHRYRAARTDRPAVAADLRNLEREAQAILTDLGEEGELEQARVLLLPSLDRARIQRLATEYARLRQADESTVTAVEELEAELTAKRERRDCSPPPVETTRLAEAIAAARASQSAEQELESVRLALAREEEETQLALRRLPGWTGSLEQVETLQLPVAETLDSFEDLFRKSDEARQALQRRQADYARDLGQLEQELRALSADESLPTEQRLNEARAQRNQAWQLLRRARAGRPPAAEEVRNFLHSLHLLHSPHSPGTGNGTLEDAFELLMGRADQLADRLRHEADRVARYAQTQTDLDRLREAAAQARDELAGLDRQRCQVDAEWQQLWQALGVVPRTPREMRSWLQRHGDLLNRARSLRELRRRETACAQTLESETRRLLAELAATGVAMSPAPRGLGALLRAAEQTLRQLESATEERRLRDYDLEKLAREQEKRRQARAQAASRLAEWQRAWDAAVAALPRASASDPADASRLLELLQQLSLKLSSVEQQRRRLLEIDAFCGQFEHQLRTLVDLIFPDSSASAAADLLAADLLERFRQADSAAKEQQRLRDELRERVKRAEQATAELHECQSQIDQLCQEAGCASADELLAVWERSEHQRRVEERWEQLHGELRKLSGTSPLEQFIEEARAEAADTLPERIAQLDDRLHALERELVDEISPAITREQSELQKLDGSSEAAQAEERARDAIAGLATAAEEYAILRLAQVALRRGIERYREQHQGPILRVASELFARLTVGSFQGLKVDYDPSGNPVVVGVRGGTGDLVPVAGMSEGTADQLYLALRCAWLHSYLDSHESLPFIVDDILIRFDDARSQETLKILAELSRRTQVLFFTHHRHLVEAARRLLPDDVLFVAELARS